MAPIRVTVAGVVQRAGNTLAQAPPVVQQPQPHLDHNHDALLIVEDPRLPNTPPDGTPPTSSHRNGVSTTRHVALGVVRINEASANQRIGNMRTCARGWLSKWPLESVVRLFGGGPTTQTEAPAYQAKQDEPTTEGISKGQQEPDMMPDGSPPAYFDSKPQSRSNDLGD